MRNLFLLNKQREPNNNKILFWSLMNLLIVFFVVEEVKQHSALALGAFGINIRQHDIHETPRTTYEKHCPCLFSFTRHAWALHRNLRRTGRFRWQIRGRYRGGCPRRGQVQPHIQPWTPCSLPHLSSPITVSNCLT